MTLRQRAEYYLAQLDAGRMDSHPWTRRDRLVLLLAEVEAEARKKERVRLLNTIHRAEVRQEKERKG